MRFKDLAIGAVFEFDRTGLSASHGLASGPWVKTTARSYKHKDTGIYYKVGTVNVIVIKL